MASFSKGTSFTDGVTGDVTAAKLHALVDAATPVGGLVTDRTAKTSVVGADLALIADSADSNNLKKVSITNLANNLPTAVITNGTVTTLNSTTGTITTGVIPTLTSTTLITSGTGTAAAPAIVPTGDPNTGVFFPAADTIAASTSGTEAMRIDSSGRVGIGTTAMASSGADLHIFKAGGSTIRLDRTGTGTCTIQSAETGVAERDLTLSANTLLFNTSSTERLQIGAEGRIGICADSGVNTLTIESKAAAGTSIALLRGIPSSTGVFSAGGASIVIYTNGNIQNTNNSYGSLSDIKLKENISSASSQWGDIKSLQVRKFCLKSDDERKQMIGLIAQEVEQISPNLIEETPDKDRDGNDLGTTTKGVKYSILYMKAVKALQEAMERIEQLESKVAALEAA